MRELDGPEMYQLIVHGRKDAENEHEAGSLDNIPQNSSTAAEFEAKFLDKGFSEEQAVALTAIEAFATIKKPLRDKNWSIFPMIDNYYFEHLRLGAKSEYAPLPQDKLIVDNPNFKEHIDKFAEDKKEFFRVFGEAWEVMSTLGMEEQPQKLVTIMDRDLHKILLDRGYA